MANKQLLQAAGDGTAVPAGYIGQKISYRHSQTASVSSSAYTNLSFASDTTSVTLSPGIWLATLAVLEAAGTANAAIRMGLSTDSSSNFSDLATGLNSVDIPGASPSANVQANLTMMLNITSQTSYYAKANVATTTSRNYVVVFNAIRLA